MPVVASLDRSRRRPLDIEDNYNATSTYCILYVAGTGSIEQLSAWRDFVSRRPRITC
jgi:hypothetical protein